MKSPNAELPKSLNDIEVELLRMAQSATTDAARAIEARQLLHALQAIRATLRPPKHWRDAYLRLAKSHTA